MQKITPGDRSRASQTPAEAASPTVASPNRPDAAPPSSKRSHLHSLHHRHHNHQHTKDKAQSAIQLRPPASLVDLAKPGNRTSSTTPSSSVGGSRRESLIVQEAPEKKSAQAQPARPEDAARERQRRKARDEELRGSLHTLTELSFQATRQLDETFYAVLEKVANLRSTIAGLQELSSLTRQLYHNFQRDGSELEGDFERQIDAFDGFSSQQRAIEELESRIGAGRRKAEALKARLDDTKRRVEAREKSEEEWQAKMSRRLRILWGALGGVIAIFVLAVLFQHLRGRYTERSAGLPPSQSPMNVSDAPLASTVKEMIRSVQEHTSSASGLATALSTSSEAGDASVARMVDEL